MRRMARGMHADAQTLNGIYKVKNLSSDLDPHCHNSGLLIDRPAIRSAIRGRTCQRFFERCVTVFGRHRTIENGSGIDGRSGCGGRRRKPAGAISISPGRGRSHWSLDRDKAGCPTPRKSSADGEIVQNFRSQGSCVDSA